MITRENAKELLPILQAFAEGEDIQIATAGEWKDVDESWAILFTEPPHCYRIKPKQKYRPFETKEECWNEMLKHQPFGWVTDKCKYVHIVCVRQSNIEYSPDEDDNILYSCIMTFSDVLEQGYTFADGTPFGIKKEE